MADFELSPTSGQLVTFFRLTVTLRRAGITRAVDALLEDARRELPPREFAELELLLDLNEEHDRRRRPALRPAA